ncbi:MAG TPA: single-stranded DNA-binding protein [Mycobacteriales bacterium]|jgi:single-strand DNA-binding protein|nr:single-stranded DNA-binding protein [Mycobacteriales bacterium]
MDTYITVQGNLTADPIGRTTANGAAVANLRIASNSRRFDREAGAWRDGDPMYIGATCWRTLAVNVCASLRKGDSVVVSGKLLQRTYEAKEGGQRTVLEIDAVAVGPDLNRWPADLRRPSRAADPETVDAESEATEDATDAVEVEAA